MEPDPEPELERFAVDFARADVDFARADEPELDLAFAFDPDELFAADVLRDVAAREVVRFVPLALPELDVFR